ncbi:TPR repeat-containing protein [Candidatus Magnetomorum sp. HK-1]|nr:TPR repeat-containing protein [Candidatus Magnetomorum sp. HK-1]
MTEIFEKNNNCTNSQASACSAKVEKDDYDPDSLFQKGLAAHQKGEWALAALFYKKIIDIDPNYSDAFHLLGVINSVQGQNKEAVENIKKAIQISGKGIYFNSLGVIYLRIGKCQNAIHYFNKALTYDDKLADIYNNLAQAQLVLGNAFEAMTNYQKSLHIQSNVPQIVSNYLMCLNYVSLLSAKDIYKAHIRFDTLFRSKKKIQTSGQRLFNKDLLRIGYVSSDFCQNSVSYFISPVLKNHDLNNFHISCYANVNQPDKITQNLQKYPSNWVNTLHMTDDQMAKKIYQDKIDILVDLSGHFSGNRLGVFAQQPAPVQITYLGYPNTSGLSTIQYRLTDIIADPEEHDAFYSEQLIRMPQGFLCYQPQTDSPSVSPLPATKNGYITLGSFNNLAKVNATVIKIWSEILCNLPNARLLLKSRPLSDEETKDYVINKFISHGVDHHQIQCMGFFDSIEEHLSAYHHVDLALDSFPYNGTTTTCDALWMGVPVITRLGECHAGRVGASILSFVGLNDFIADSDENYISKTIQLCQNLTLLREIRKKLRNLFNTSPLMDAKQFTKKLEKTYQRLWEKEIADRENKTCHQLQNY